MDSYGIKKDWDNYKMQFCEMEKGIEKFVKKPTSRKWGTLLRKESKLIEKLGRKIKKNVVRQRQDYQYDYS